MFEGFVHPGLAFGAALAAVPLLIHLLNRQRHRPMQWAAMRFVLAAYKRTRRRAQIENLILLLLRMAAVALLALAIARPFIGKDSPLAPLTESRQELVLVLDGSASTGYREGVASVRERILERAREILTELDGSRGDRVRLVLAGAAPRVLSTRSPEDALALLSTVTDPLPESLDLASTLAEVVGFAEEEAAGTESSSLEVRLLTDLQRRSFVPRLGATAAAGGDDVEDPEAARGADFLGALDKLEALGVPVIVEDLGPPTIDPPNQGIHSIATFGPVLGPGATVEVGVTVASYGSGAGSSRVALEVNGERLPSRSLDLSGERSQVVFPVTFADPGHHVLTARLEGDRLAIDDTRSAIVYVPPPMQVLLVNGSPGATIEEDEVGYLRAVLEPPGEGWMDGAFASADRAPFVPKVVSEAEFAGGDLDLAPYDVIVLANTAAPPGRATEALEARVAAGAALLITGGDRAEADLSQLAARFWRADGTGLLPAELGRRIEVRDRRTSYFRAATFEETHPALAFFADERWQPFLTEVPVYAFLAAKPADDARVLIRLDDGDAHPLLVERAYDRGRVLLWTSTIDKAWTKLPESPATLIPLVHELMRYAGRGSAPERNLPVGAALVAEVDAFPRGVVVQRPDGSRRPLDGEPTQVGDGLWRLPAVTPTDQVGVWTLAREDAPDVTFALQLDPAEGDLRRLGPNELGGIHPALELWNPEVAASGADDGDGNERGELWRWLAALCLAALVAESLWAAWIGSRRRLG